MKKEIGEEKTCEGEPLHIAAHLARCQPGEGPRANMVSIPSNLVNLLPHIQAIARRS